MAGKYSLDRVKELIEAGNGIVIAKSSALDRVIEIYRNSNDPKNRHTAHAFIEDGICELEDGNYYNTVDLQDGTKADEYAMSYDGRDWYVKLSIKIDSEGDEFVYDVSFHPPGFNIKTTNGEFFEGRV